MKHVIRYNPRDWQKTIHNCRSRYAVIMAHRTAGKTWSVLVESLRRSLSKKGVYAFLSPEKSQTRKNLWPTVEDFFLDIPGVTYNKQEMSIKLPNGSTWYLLGALNKESLRGGHYDGMVVDEIANVPKKIFEENILPMVQARKGWMFCIGTPQSSNDLLMELYARGKDPEYPDWQSFKFSILDTGIYSPEQIKVMESTMAPSSWRREYLCEPAVDSATTVYQDILDFLRASERIKEVPYNPHLLVHCGWDLGLADKTCIWFMQVDPGTRTPLIIDFYSNNNADISHFFHHLLTKKYTYGMMFLPHDAARASLTGHRSIYQQMLDNGYNAKVLPKTASVISDIPAVRDFMQQCLFDSNNCREGLNELEYYEYKQDHFTGQPLDAIKTNGHKDAADAFRYLALGTLAFKPPATPSEGRRVMTNIRRAWDALKD